MKSVVSIDELRTNLAELIGRVMYGKDRVVIKKYNREAAILMSVDEYEKLVDPAKRFSKKQWENKFSVIDKIKEGIPEIDQTVLEAEVTKAIKEIRAAKRKNA
jgi:prevent-host-death family protein